MIKKEKIVVTGIGLVTPLGSNREKTWEKLINGQSGINYVKQLPIPAAGVVDDISISETLPRSTGLAHIAAREAIADAGIDLNRIDKRRVACTVSSSKPNVGFSDIFSFSQESAGMYIRKIFGFAGPGGNYSAACATGLVSIKAGMMYLLDDEADFCIAGSSESSLNELYIAGFKQMGVLAECTENPEMNIKPFSADRTGFLPGEGAGVFVLEKESSAHARGVPIYGTIESCCLGNDGYNPIIFNGNGKHIARVIHESIKKAGWKNVDYINAHGTATKLNDKLETSALKHVFGADNSIRCSSTKAGTGHLLGAAGSVEAAFVLLAMRDGIVPPTLNLKRKDPECDLNYTPLTACEKKVDRALSLSYGFGGHIGVIAFKKAVASD